LKGLEQAGLVQAGPDQKMAPGVGPEGMPPPGPPKPPGGSAGGPGGPGGPPPGAGGPPPPQGKGAPYGSKLKPGEVPNKPGVVPIGAPSFASTRQADASQFSWSPQPSTTTPTTSTPPGMTAPSGNPGAIMNPPCSKCGGPTQGGVCARCAQAAGGAEVPGTLARVKPLVIHSSVKMSPIEAHRELTAAYASQGYKVHQLQPQDDGTIIAELRRV
jgi:hypothetical protein